MVEPSPFDEHEDIVDPTGDLIDSMMDFADEHAKKLVAIERTISGSVFGGGVCGWSPIRARLEARERVHVTDLFPEESPDPLTRKILVALSAVSEELRHLAGRGERELVPWLLLFGWSARGDGAEAWRPGVLEAQVGRSMGLFQHTHNWHQRTCAAVVNCLQQLSALYRPESPVFPAWQRVTPTPVLEALAAVGHALCACDAAINANPMLKKGWDLYAALVRKERGKKEGGEEGGGEEGGGAEGGGGGGKVEELEAMLVSLGDVVPSARFVASLLEENFDAPFEEGAPSVEVGGNRTLVGLLTGASVDRVQAAVKQLGTNSEADEGRRFVGACFLYALARVIEPPGVRPDPKPFQQLWKALEAFPIVPLLGPAVFRVDTFLRSHCSIRGVDVARLRPDPADALARSAKRSAESLPARAALLRDRLHAWLLRAEQVFASSPIAGSPAPPPASVLRARVKAVAQGVALAEQGGAAAREYLALQTALGAPLGLRALQGLARIVEGLKVVEGTLVRFGAELALTLPMASREAAARAREALRNVRMRLEVALERTADPGLAVLTVATAAEALDQLLLGTEGWSAERRAVAEALAAVVQQPAAKMSQTQAKSLQEALFELSIVAGAEDRISRAADCAFLYFSRDILRAILPRLATDELESRRIPFLLAAFSDPLRLLLRAEHLPLPASTDDSQAGTAEEHLFPGYMRFLRAAVESALVHPLCSAVEADLRLHVHALLLPHLPPPNPKATRSPASPPPVPAHLLDLPPLRLGTQLYSLRQAATAWLEGVLYSGTTVALHDWRTYGEMAALAADKYGLVLADSHLPMGTLDTGLDVLRIMRRLKVFVARFCYSMHEEIFVERQAEKGSKHLHVVSARSVAGSVRQHGAGMLNTTVNVAYRYLAQKFRVFSQFLFDDDIRSFLSAERKWFRRNRKACDDKYPLERARQLHKEIRRLGTTAKGISFIDKFRLLITQMGNALGFVRMVRSAGMRSAAGAVRFIPDLETLKEFRFAQHCQQGMVRGKGGVKDGAEEDDFDDSEEEDDDDDEEEEEEGGEGGEGGEEVGGLSEETVEAASALDEVVEVLLAHFSEDVDYFKMLVEIFQKGLLKQLEQRVEEGGEEGKKRRRRKRESHLKAFHACIPALTLSYIDAIRSAKENLDKAHKGREAFFSDDGFALGVAYLLAVLRQDKAFESLHWFESVQHSIEAETAKAKSERAKLGRGGGEGAAALDFRQRRLAAQAKEFQSLSFSLFGARIFFRQEDEHEGRATKLHHDAATAFKAVHGTHEEEKAPEDAAGEGAGEAGGGEG